MQALFDRMKEALAADDLFWRVSCFFYAVVGAGIGLLIAWVLLASSARETMWWLWYALLWLLAAAFVAWGLVLLLGCVSPPKSRPARWAAVALPQIVSFDGETGLLATMTFFPAALLTLLLRGIGIRGCKSPQSADLIAEAERNTGSP